MKNTFRHALYLHPCFFHAVVNLTQCMIKMVNPFSAFTRKRQIKYLGDFVDKMPPNLIAKIYIFLFITIS